MIHFNIHFKQSNRGILMTEMTEDVVSFLHSPLSPNLLKVTSSSQKQKEPQTPWTQCCYDTIQLLRDILDKHSVLHRKVGQHRPPVHHIKNPFHFKTFLCALHTVIKWILKKRIQSNKKEGKINKGWSAIGRMQFPPWHGWPKRSVFTNHSGWC